MSRPCRSHAAPSPSIATHPAAPEHHERRPTTTEPSKRPRGHQDDGQEADEEAQGRHRQFEQQRQQREPPRPQEGAEQPGRFGADRRQVAVLPTRALGHEGRLDRWQPRNEPRLHAGFRRVALDRHVGRVAHILHDVRFGVGRLFQGLPRESHARPGQQTGQAQPLQPERTHVVLHPDRELRDPAHPGGAVLRRAHQVRPLHGATALSGEGRDALDGARVGNAVRVDVDDDLRRLLAERVERVADGVPLAPVLGVIADEHLGAERLGDRRRAVGAVIGDHQQAIALGQLRTDRLDRAGDLILFVMRRHDDGDRGARRSGGFPPGRRPQASDQAFRPEHHGGRRQHGGGGDQNRVEGGHARCVAN